MNDSSTSNPSLDDPTQEPARRGFMVKAVAVVIGAFTGLVPLVAGLATFFDPLARRKAAGGDDDYIRVGSYDSLPESGLPQPFPVIADRVNAWNRYPNEPIGAVFVRRLESSGGQKKVQVFNAICPHAGCFVSVVKRSEDSVFLCPCHTSSFALDGEKLNESGKTNPSPRNMDELEVDQAKLDATGEVWVKFVNYYPGKHEQEVKP